MTDDILLEGREWLLLAAVVLFVVGAGAVYVVQNPAAPWQLEAAYSSVLSAGAADVTASTTLKLPVEDAAYLNRVYRDLNTQTGDNVGEQGYCVHLVGEEMRVQQAGTLEAGEGSVAFTTANCEPSLFGQRMKTVSGLLHFHPPYSEPVLSGPDTAVDEQYNDKETLLSSDFRLSCVQAGLVPEEDGARPAALKCYLPPESGDIDDPFPEIAVQVVGQG